MFKRVMIANRGEIAWRVMRTLLKMGIEPVAIYSEADKDAPYLKKAKKSICIGPAPAKESYLCNEAILQAALQSDCEAIHPGYGFLSENALFATQCEQQKLSFIGPKPRMMELMGDKSVARATMASLGVPTLPGSDDVLKNAREAELLAEKMGYPVLLKARSGGGGKGMRLVQNADELKGAFLEAQREAESAFRDGALYLEKFVKNARHIEFQVLGDSYGNIICLGERECSVQRKNQKLIEEAPANNLLDAKRQHIIGIIIKALQSLGYTSAGTLEFLLDDSGQLYFMEMNTRLQVEHPITELTTGIDLVEWQVRIAANEKLNIEQNDIKVQGHAIECRINAEDPERNFLPSPGCIEMLHWPKASSDGPVRIDTHVEQGFKIVPFYDSLVAKIIAYGKDRKEALTRMKQTLQETSIEGIHTTLNFHKAIMEEESFMKGSYDCSFIEKHFDSLNMRASS
jgi:acetyl-CoA carboxylase, biotin carboxylase subunit